MCAGTHEGPTDSDTLLESFVPVDSVQEFCNRSEHRIRLVALRGVAAIFERENFDWAGGLPLDRFHLGHGAVLIFAALDDEDGAGDLR